MNPRPILSDSSENDPIFNCVVKVQQKKSKKLGTMSLNPYLISNGTSHI
jgi:hypothetical protein